MEMHVRFVLPHTETKCEVTSQMGVSVRTHTHARTHTHTHSNRKLWIPDIRLNIRAYV